MTRSQTIKVSKAALMERIQDAVVEADAAYHATVLPEAEQEYASSLAAKKEKIREARAKRRKQIRTVEKFCLDALALIEAGEDPWTEKDWHGRHNIAGSGKVEMSIYNLDDQLPEFPPPSNPAADHLRAIAQLKMDIRDTLTISVGGSFGEYL